MKKNKAFLDFINEFKNELLEMDQDEFQNLLSESKQEYTEILEYGSFSFEDASTSIAEIYGGQESFFYDVDLAVRFDIQPFDDSIISTFSCSSSIAVPQATLEAWSKFVDNFPATLSSGAIVLGSSYLPTESVNKIKDNDDIAGNDYSCAA